VSRLTAAVRRAGRVLVDAVLTAGLLDEGPPSDGWASTASDWPAIRLDMTAAEANAAFDAIDARRAASRKGGPGNA
jgi:hypothetical protein